MTIGPPLPQILQSPEPCAVRINDTFTYVGSGNYSYIYDWSEEVFSSIAHPSPFYINGVAGCGSATTSTGQRQVVIAGLYIFFLFQS